MGCLLGLVALAGALIALALLGVMLVAEPLWTLLGLALGAWIIVRASRGCSRFLDEYARHRDDSGRGGGG